MFAEYAEVIDGQPRYIVRVITTSGVDFRATTSYRLEEAADADRSLLLISDSSEVRKLMDVKTQEKYRNFLSEIEKKKRRTAIGTAKNVVGSIRAGSTVLPSVCLTVHNFGVIPVFDLQQPIKVVNALGEVYSYSVALMPDFPCNAKVTPVDTRKNRRNFEKQLSLLSVADEEVSEEFVILSGYDVELFRVISKYFEDIGYWLRFMMDHSSGEALFTSLREIKALLSRQIGIKLDQYSKASLGTLNISDAENPKALSIVERNIEWLIFAELGRHYIHQLLAKYVKLYSIGYDPEHEKEFGDFIQELQLRWNVNSDRLETLVDNGPDLLSALYKLCTELDDGANNAVANKIDWLNDVQEFALRIEFFKKEKFSLWMLNVFLSKRTDCEFSKLVLHESKAFPRHVKVFHYHRTVPSGNDFPVEIRWFIWGSFAFLSLVTDSVLKDCPPGAALKIDWIVKELDLALMQHKQSIGVIKSAAVGATDILREIKEREFTLFDGYERPYTERIEAVMRAFDPSKSLHIGYDPKNPRAVGAVVQDISEWAKQELYEVAATYYRGWLSLFSDNAKKVIKYVLKNSNRRIGKDELERKTGLTSGALSQVRDNLNKFPAVIESQPVTLVGFERASGGKRAFEFFSNFESTLSQLYPGLEMDGLRSRIF